MRKYILTLITLACLLTNATFAQDAAMRSGDKYFKQFNFNEAVSYYKKAIKKNANSIEAKQKLANTYFIMNDYVNAETWYAQAIQDPACSMLSKIYYGQTLRALGKYQDADRIFKQINEKYPDDIRSKELMNRMNDVSSLSKDDKTHMVENLTDLNTPLIDFGPAISKENTLMFASNRGNFKGALRTDVWTDNRFIDLWQMNMDPNTGAVSGKATILKGKQPNKKYHDGPACYVPTSNELVFTRNSPKKSADNTHRLKIFTASWKDNKWSDIKEFPYNSQDYNVGHPTVTADGNTLYFMSDMPGGYGEMDIYMCKKEGGNWGKPTNLGPNVNTPGRDMFPYIAKDGTLYFSSDSRVGLGGLDIYSVSKAGDSWGNATNLGYPVNTRWDDFEYTLNENGSFGYLVSNREGGKGMDDIYRFSRKPAKAKLCVVVVDSITRKPIPGAGIALIREGAGLMKKDADENGKACWDLEKGGTVTVGAKKAGYASTSMKVNVPAGRTTEVELPLYKKPGGFDLTVCVTEKVGEAAPVNLAGATVTLKDLITGEVQTCVTTANCQCAFELKPNTDYEVCATKETNDAKVGYQKDCRRFTTKGKTPPASLFENLQLLKIEEGQTIKLENIYYDLNKWFIRPDAAVELTKLVNLMNQFPNMEIELSSHTDCRATEKYNMDLSGKRAQSCVDWVAGRGIRKSRMLAKGYGESRLTNGCACEGAVKSTCSEAEHQANRRTEFTILRLK